MGALFAKKKPPSRITEQDKAVLQLKSQRDKLKQYQKRIELGLASDRQLAKRLLADGKKDRAKLLLRKKRYQEQLLQNTDAQLEHLDRMVHDIEFAQIEMQVLQGLKTGNTALKKMNDLFSIEEIERIMDETQEGVEKQQEIDAILSGALTAEDEEAVEAELEEIIGQSLPNIPTVVLTEPELPDVPTTSPERKVAPRESKKIAMEAS
ncbi:Vacuolar protein sorting 20 [Carabus blaptoides fortunei]